MSRWFRPGYHRHFLSRASFLEPDRAGRRDIRPRAVVHFGSGWGRPGGPAEIRRCRPPGGRAVVHSARKHVLEPEVAASASPRPSDRTSPGNQGPGLDINNPGYPSLRSQDPGARTESGVSRSDGCSNGPGPAGKGNAVASKRCGLVTSPAAQYLLGAVGKSSVSQSPQPVRHARCAVTRLGEAEKDGRSNRAVQLASEVHAGGPWPPRRLAMGGVTWLPCTAEHTVRQSAPGSHGTCPGERRLGPSHRRSGTPGLVHTPRSATRENWFATCLNEDQNDQLGTYASPNVIIDSGASQSDMGPGSPGPTRQAPDGPGGQVKSGTEG
jgi:hypothetical protein